MLGNSCWIATEANTFLHLIIPWERCVKRRGKKGSNQLLVTIQKTFGSKMFVLREKFPCNQLSTSCELQQKRLGKYFPATLKPGFTQEEMSNTTLWLLIAVLVLTIIFRFAKAVFSSNAGKQQHTDFTLRSAAAFPSAFENHSIIQDRTELRKSSDPISHSKLI